MSRLNRMVKNAYPVMGSLLTLVAVVGGVQPYTFWSFYQPKAPKCLK